MIGVAQSSPRSLTLTMTSAAPFAPRESVAESVTGQRPARANVWATELWPAGAVWTDQSSGKVHFAETASPAASATSPVKVTLAPRCTVIERGDVIVATGGVFEEGAIASSHMPRPCVAARIVDPSGNISMSYTETAGMPVPKRSQWAPPFVER